MHKLKNLPGEVSVSLEQLAAELSSDLESTLSSFLPNHALNPRITQDKKQLSVSIRSEQNPDQAVLNFSILRPSLSGNDWIISPITVPDQIVSPSIAGISLRSLMRCLKQSSKRGVVLSMQSSQKLLPIFFNQNFYLLSEVNLKKRIQYQQALNRHQPVLIQDAMSKGFSVEEYHQELSGTQNFAHYPLIGFLNSDESDREILSNIPSDDPKSDLRLRMFFRSQFFFFQFQKAQELLTNLYNLPPKEAYLSLVLLRHMVNAFGDLLPDESLRLLCRMSDSVPDFDPKVTFQQQYAHLIPGLKTTFALIETASLNFERHLLDEQIWRSFKDKF